MSADLEELKKLVKLLRYWPKDIQSEGLGKCEYFLDPLESENKPSPVLGQLRDKPEDMLFCDILGVASRKQRSLEKSYLPQH
jgi:hypothetical protein